MTDPNLQTRHGRYRDLGLKPSQCAACLREDAFIARWRVVRIDRGHCSILGFDVNDEERELRSRTDDWDFAVGDWVLVTGNEEELAISELLERSSHLRRASGDALSPEWIAANLDTVFVVAAYCPWLLWL